MSCERGTAPVSSAKNDEFPEELSECYLTIIYMFSENRYRHNAAKRYKVISIIGTGVLFLVPFQY
jgi:hypothetical protein